MLGFIPAGRELLSGDAMKEYNRARVYLDENYESQEHFTALGSFYFLHESLKNISQFDFKAKKYKKVTGKEIYSDTLESTPMLEKEKFPQDYFPECKWSRKGFIRTRWCLADCAFDLVNIHLFHDASNLVAWETSPSVYSGIRHKALGYVLDRIIDQRFEKASYFVFGDFNFRLDSKSVVETLCTKATMQTVRAADTNEVVKLIFRESDNDRKVMLQLEKKLFDYFNQEVFRDDNGTALLEFDKELSVFKDRLYELDISFPPSYPYSEDSSQGRQYMNTRCPAWCDRVLMSPSAKELILRSESEEKVVTYDHIGPSVCMGDHKVTEPRRGLGLGPRGGPWWAFQAGPEGRAVVGFPGSPAPLLCLLSLLHRGGQVGLFLFNFNKIPEGRWVGLDRQVGAAEVAGHSFTISKRRLCPPLAICGGRFLNVHSSIFLASDGDHPPPVRAGEGRVTDPVPRGKHRVFVPGLTLYV
ncbi:inositol polyphosphate-5-phosphatase A isoform X4 [Delphinapterus leucas]|uniref:inositol-polyphosphate 5-phosphatase n=1 Tax=Delphinapterus leucas TaxID=9749 RepID=A0A2Y9N4C7_DELLE|nr:inositol polyphosphate-5-phosphatase A isoform X4 [Delphinapterus leucas]